MSQSSQCDVVVQSNANLGAVKVKIISWTSQCLGMVIQIMSSTNQSHIAVQSVVLWFSQSYYGTVSRITVQSVVLWYSLLCHGTVKVVS